MYYLIYKQWKNIIILIFLAGGFGATYQISIIFMKQCLPIVLPQTTYIISTFSILIVVCFAIFMTISGFIANLFGFIVVIQTAQISTK